MRVETHATQLADVLLLNHERFSDERGFFQEVFRDDVFGAAGLPSAFCQINHSRSRRGVLRGLHFQWQPPMAKLMRVIRGAAFLVAVDLRPDAQTLGGWVGVELDEHCGQQLWAPACFARGFVALSDMCEVEYLCTSRYHPAGEANIAWNDPDIRIAWPVETPTLSDRDRTAQSLAMWLTRPEAQAFALARP
jgi:dTDP-4-dehydrorhamnose 3,5-epimerase